ncbi:MAG: glycosyltransferase, partial [Deltaproteobacteria bacterium]|nr:glycosyltransferase [Deltaproteobacteria bacterium]
MVPGMRYCPPMWTLLAALFWADLAILVFTYVGYPLVLRLAAVLRGRREVAAGGETAPVTLVVSLHDELEVLEEKIRNSLGLSWEGTASVVLADDGSEDGSEELCHRYATARPDEVRHVRIPRGGKNRALDAALATIPGGIVVFTDANAFLEPGALRLLASTFQDPHVGCAVGRLRFRRQGQT